MKHFALLLLFLFPYSLFLVPLKAQNDPGLGRTLHGRLLDSASLRPMEFGVIAVLKSGSEDPIATTLSNDSGYFRIVIQDTGKLRVVIAVTGYLRTQRSVPAGTSEYELGNITLATDPHMMKTVSIVEQKDVLEQTPDMTIYHADKDVTTAGSTAIDLLKKVPGVSVDINGNLELMGNAGIKILINGKPSVLLNTNPADVLMSIPADQIERIEVISNPGAKYEAQGSGIINIVLKKEMLPGLSGNISLTTGTRIEKGSGVIAYSHEDFSIAMNVFGNYYIPQDASTEFFRHAVVNDTTHTLLETGINSAGRNNFEPSLEINWELGDNDEVSASIGWEDYRNNGTGNLEILEYGDDITQAVISTRNNSNRTRESAIELYADYTHVIDTLGKEFTLSAEYSGDRDSSDHNVNQFMNYDLTGVADASEYYFRERENNLGREDDSYYSADFTLPLRNKSIIETGGHLNIYNVRSVYTMFNYDSLTGIYNLDATQSNDFISKQQVYSAYFTWGFPIGKFKVKPGVRYEQTFSDHHLADSASHVTSDYGTFIPTFSIFRKFGTNVFKLNYSKRIERPEYDDMNPFVNTSDPNNISTGNTSLVPEIQHRIELSYTWVSKAGTTLLGTLYARRQTNDIQHYSLYFPVFINAGDSFSNVSVTQPFNMVTRSGIGSNIFFSFTLHKILMGRINVGLNEDIFDNTIDPNEATVYAFRYNLNMNLTFLLPWKLTAEAFGFFNSPRYTLQGYRPAYSEYSLGVKKVFAKKRGSIGLNATDPFSKDMKFETHTEGDGFSQTTTNRIPIRSFGLTFSWRFGQSEEEDQEEENNGNPLFQKGNQ